MSRICEVCGKRLADRIPCCVEQVQFCFLSVFLTDAVISHLPSSLIEQRCRAFRVILHLRSLIVPRKLIADAVCRTSVPV